MKRSKAQISTFTILGILLLFVVGIGIWFVSNIKEGTEFVFTRENNPPERYILDIAKGRVGYLKDFEPAVQAQYAQPNRALNP